MVRARCAEINQHFALISLITHPSHCNVWQFNIIIAINYVLCSLAAKVQGKTFLLIERYHSTLMCDVRAQLFIHHTP